MRVLGHSQVERVGPGGVQQPHLVHEHAQPAPVRGAGLHVARPVGRIDQEADLGALAAARAQVEPEAMASVGAWQLGRGEAVHLDAAARLAPGVAAGEVDPQRPRVAAAHEREGGLGVRPAAARAVGPRLAKPEAGPQLATALVGGGEVEARGQVAPVPGVDEAVGVELGQERLGQRAVAESVRVQRVHEALGMLGQQRVRIQQGRAARRRHLAYDVVVGRRVAEREQRIVGRPRPREGTGEEHGHDARRLGFVHERLQVAAVVQKRHAVRQRRLRAQRVAGAPGQVEQRRRQAQRVPAAHRAYALRVTLVAGAHGLGVVDAEAEVGDVGPGRLDLAEAAQALEGRVAVDAGVQDLEVPG